MMRDRATRNAAGWLAALALMAALLAPAMAQVLTTGNGRVWAEVCSAAGSGQIQLPGDSAPGAPAAHASHCALCTVGGASVMLPPALPTAWLPVSIAFALEDAATVVPAVARAWPAGRPRGPPWSA